MREVTPFRVVHPVQGEGRKVEPTGDPVEIMPIMSFNPLSFEKGIRNFGPARVVEETVEEPADAPIVEADVTPAEVSGEGDVGPKAATSSAIDSASGSGSVSESTSMLMHPSTPSLDPETPASAEKVSSESSESPETKNDGWPLPLALA
jgi:hypothetical protein